MTSARVLADRDPDTLYANRAALVQKVIAGTFFQQHPALITWRDVHPTSAGYGEMRRLWAQSMIQNVYATSR